MQSSQEPITGKEQRRSSLSPYQALVHFYYAFNHRDINAMAENWAGTDEISMDNPLGGIRRGWHEIRPVYERIFNSPAEIYVEYYDYTIHETDDMFFAVGRERGYFLLGKNEVKLAIRTTRIFKKIEQKWKQIHHHGSIDDPKLLATYQVAVLGEQKNLSCE